MEISDLNIEIEGLQKLRDDLLDQIKEKKQVLDNLDSQKHTADISNEAQAREEKLAFSKKVFEEESKLEQKRSELRGRETAIEDQEETLKGRKHALEQREIELVDVDDKRKALDEERANFNKYKFEIERNLEEAQNIIAEAAEKENALTIREQMVVSAENKVKELEKTWNDKIGELQAEEKRITILRENLEGLQRSSV